MQIQRRRQLGYWFDFINALVAVGREGVVLLRIHECQVVSVVFLAQRVQFVLVTIIGQHHANQLLLCCVYRLQWQ